MPVTDEFFGVSQLQLCDGDRWKESVDVCLEVFSISRGSIQNDLCNLATLSFQRKSPPPGSPPPTRPTDMPPGPPPPPRPTGLPPPGPTDMMPPGPPRNCTPNQGMCTLSQFCCSHSLTIYYVYQGVCRLSIFLLLLNNYMTRYIRMYLKYSNSIG